MTPSLCSSTSSTAVGVGMLLVLAPLDDVFTPELKLGKMCPAMWAGVFVHKS